MPDIHTRSFAQLLLAIDTCGPSGSVALARTDGPAVELLGQRQLEGRSYSSTLIAAVGELLQTASVQLADLAAIIVVNGPGSFTGVRVGLAAVKGLAEAAHLPVVAVSRLEVLAAHADLPAAALDAHRQEVFLRIAGADGTKELLAGAADLAAIDPAPQRIAVCDEAAAALIASAWPETEQLRTEPPTAAGAVLLGAPRVAAGEFADVALLDGHYLRRSDAEIFGDPLAAARQKA